jgi:hypothetical protein
MFSFAFIFFSLITHIYFSLLENDLRRTVLCLNGYYQYYQSKSILLSVILRIGIWKHISDGHNLDTI